MDHDGWIGIDIGGTNLQAGLVDHAGSPRGRQRDRTNARAGLDALLDRLLEGISDLLAESGLDPGDLGGVGIGAPSPIDPDHRVLLDARNLGWTEVPLGELLGRRLRDRFGREIAVTLENDVNAALWGEFRLGAGRGGRDLLGVWVGTGVGGAFILDGRLRRGAFGTAGEIGNTCVQPMSSPRTRTLEQHASRLAVEQSARALVEANVRSTILDRAGGRATEIAAAHVIAAWRDDEDPLAADLVEHAADLLGTGIANVVTLLGTDVIVLGGGLVELGGEAFVARIRAAFDRHVFPPACRAAALRTTELRSDAGWLGAAMLARDRVVGGTIDRSL